MTRGPTSRVRISSVSPLLRRRLFFQPPYSTFSTVTGPLGAGWAVTASGRATVSPTRKARIGAGQGGTGSSSGGAGAVRPPRCRSGDLADRFAGVLRQLLAAD